MKSILNKLCVLELNKSWFPITLKTPKKVFENFSTGNLIGLHIAYSDEDLEKEDFSSPTELVPTKWEDWIKLPVRDYDLSICTANMEIRIPNIVICSNYNRIPNKPPKLSKKNIMLRDNYTCQYTGKQYDRKELNIDHVVPRSQGGGNSWENLVTCHKSINTQKGGRTPKQSGFKLIRPASRPSASSLFFANKAKDPKWDMFLKHLN